jgi:penicillin-binding protein 2
MYPDQAEAEDPKGRYGLLSLMFTVFFVILLGRLFYVQIIRGDEYREAAMTSFTATEALPARRGEIKDRNGVVLARNAPTHRLRLAPERLLNPKNKTEIDETRLDKSMTRLAAVLELTREDEQAIRDEIRNAVANDEAQQPVLVEEHLVGEQCPFDGTRLIFPTEPDSSIDGEHQLFCRECGLHHEPVVADATYCPHDKSRLTWSGDGPQRHASCTKCKRSFVTSAICPADGSLMSAVEHNLVCPMCKRRFTNQVAVLESQLHDIPGAMLDTTLMRDYTQPFTFAHMLGYINYVTAKDRAQNPGVYAIDSRKGRSGVESALEAILRGKPGRVNFLKGTNREVETDRQPSEPGLDVWLTIDARLQREVRDILRYQRSAAAVVMEPESGEILALYSHPGFDPNAWSGRLDREEYEAITKNPYSPMHNKAVTAYAPGSVFKIVTSLAGLRENIVTPETVIHCPGHYTYGGRDFGCHAKSGHGPVDLIGALKGSCDVYFYQVAERLGMDKIAEYARQFGFGAPTGVEIPESVGIVPTRAWYASQPQLNWQPGLTLSVGIGQGSLTATPLQVTRSFAIIANGGRLVVPRLIHRYTDAAGLEQQVFLPLDQGRLAMTPAERALIHDGLVSVVNDEHGTALGIRDDVVVIAGKTGTAEAAMSRPGASPEVAVWLLEDHAWFTLYAPAEDPQVVITVFVEHGGSGGKDAAPLARRIFDAWRRLGLYRAAPSSPESGTRDPDVPPIREPQGSSP